VSQWGHDFRPDYFRLADAARWLGARAIVASTATATPQVAADIVARLGLRDPVRVATGFDRPNLSFAVVPCATTADKHRRLATALADPASRPAIVYAGTRMGTVRLADKLSAELGVEVLAYHAGLGREERSEAQRRFMGGEAEVVVATNAFGMGVDKADVRTVAHESVPPSIEAYYQEAGRAGRDGEPAKALLFAESRDKGLHVFFIQRSEVDDAGVAEVAQRLQAAAEPTALDAPAGTMGRFDVGLGQLGAPEEAEKVRAIVGHLARAGVLRLAPSAPDRVRGRIESAFDGRARALCRSSAREAQDARWRQYRAVWAFVEGDRCRRETILRHFGDHEAPAPRVACCDVCDPSLVPAAPVRAARGGGGARRRSARGPGDGPLLVAVDDLDAAILSVVREAEPSVGRTRVVEILRGGRSKVVAKYAYDGLQDYGTFDHMTAAQVLGRVDELLAAGTLVSTGGHYPKLAVRSAVAA
jgi:ATP-dependent DNA helicase RecQ